MYDVDLNSGEDGKPTPFLTLPRVDPTAYWTSQPPAPSPRLAGWLEAIRKGWMPNRRIRAMGYHEATVFYGVYIWEYLHIIRPALDNR